MVNQQQRPNHAQAFVAGVFPLLMQSQNHVAWSPALVSEDAAYRRWAGLGYLGIGAVAVGLLALIWFL